MNEIDPEREKLSKVQKIADMMCTAHANLRERYTRYALVLDCILIAASSFVAAHTFGAERIRSAASGFGLNYDALLSAFGLAVFIASILQFRVSWKERAGAHERSFSIYTEVKHDLRQLLAKSELDGERAEQVLARYALAGEVGAVIPETEFLRQKQKHKLKVFVSQYLDEYPGASVTLVRWKAFLRDNVGWNVFSKKK